MRDNLRSRNLAVNSYVGMLAITVVGAFASFYIIHIANDVSLTAFVSPDTYAIGPNL